MKKYIKLTAFIFESITFIGLLGLMFVILLFQNHVEKTFIYSVLSLFSSRNMVLLITPICFIFCLLAIGYLCFHLIKKIKIPSGKWFFTFLVVAFVNSFLYGILFAIYTGIFQI